MADGLAVSLYWQPGDGRPMVLVDSANEDERLVLDARADNALAVFYHPFAYAA